jgi:hypothetical protein
MMPLFDRARLFCFMDAESFVAQLGPLAPRFRDVRKKNFFGFFQMLGELDGWLKPFATNPQVPKFAMYLGFVMFIAEMQTDETQWFGMMRLDRISAFEWIVSNADFDCAAVAGLQVVNKTRSIARTEHSRKQRWLDPAKLVFVTVGS